MNRKHLVWAFALALVLALGITSFALAADDPLKVSMALSTSKFSAPAEVTVSISISNVGESDLPGPATLYYPSGKQVEEFGSPTLTVGTTKSWTGTWKVTQKELEAGRITFKVKYTIYDTEGTLVNKTKNFSKKIIYSGAEPKLEIERDIKPTTAQKDQEVTVTYHVRNTGESDVTDVSIKENSAVSKSAGVISSIPAGEEATHTFTTKMGSKDITSAATVTFKSGGKSYSQKVEGAVIKYGEVKLSATLSADKKGGAPGDTLKLTVKLKNSGTVDFTDIALTDENLGEVFSGQTVKAGETVTLEKEITITESQDVQFTVTGGDATGVPVETATGKISVIATDPTQQIVLSVEASADRTTVYEIPGNVRFTITVKNESAVEVKNITVQAVDTTVNTFSSIPAGESRTFTRQMAVSMPGAFQFTAKCRDQLSQTMTFSSNIIQISHENPTPVPTEAPVVTPPAPNYLEVPQSYEELDDSLKLPAWTEQVTEAAGLAKWIFGGIAAVLGILLAIGFIRRSARKKHEKTTMGQLSESSYRDYSTAPKRNRRSEIIDNSPDEKAAAPDEPEYTAQDSGLMAETLERLYSRNEAQDLPAEADAGGAEEAPDPNEMTEPLQAAEDSIESAAEAAHRRRRKE